MQTICELSQYGTDTEADLNHLYISNLTAQTARLIASQRFSAYINFSSTENERSRQTNSEY